MAANPAPRRTGTTSVGEALEEMLRVYRLQQPFRETYLTHHWAELVGAGIASRTGRLHVREGVLYVEILSAPLRQELVLAKTKLIELLNRPSGSEVITDIVFI